MLLPEGGKEGVVLQVLPPQQRREREGGGLLKVPQKERRDAAAEVKCAHEHMKSVLVPGEVEKIVQLAKLRFFPTAEVRD